MTTLDTDILFTVEYSELNRLEDFKDLDEAQVRFMQLMEQGEDVHLHVYETDNADEDNYTEDCLQRVRFDDKWENGELTINEEEVM